MDYAPLMKAARALGMVTTMHTGGSSIPGSLGIWAEHVLASDPTVSFHVNGAPVAMPEEGFERLVKESTVAMQICTAGNLRTALKTARLLDEARQPERLLIATDTPTGSGIMPLGMFYTITHLASLGGMPPEQAIAAATGNNARVYGLNSGMLAVGRDADVVLIDACAGGLKNDALSGNGVPRFVGRSRNTPGGMRSVRVTEFRLPMGFFGSADQRGQARIWLEVRRVRYTLRDAAPQCTALSGECRVDDRGMARVGRRLSRKAHCLHTQAVLSQALQVVSGMEGLVEDIDATRGRRVDYAGPRIEHRLPATLHPQRLRQVLATEGQGGDAWARGSDLVYGGQGARRLDNHIEGHGLAVPAQQLVDQEDLCSTFHLCQHHGTGQLRRIEQKGDVHQRLAGGKRADAHGQLRAAGPALAQELGEQGACRGLQPVRDRVF
jgi:hypothetical protein